MPDETPNPAMGGANGKICELVGVTEYMEGMPVELWRLNGRLVIRAYRDEGRNATYVELDQFSDSLKSVRVSFRR